MFCKNCGKEIDDNAVVCPHCGVATKEAEPVAAPQPQPVQQSTNTFAIVGFILSFLGGLLGLIFSILGLKKAPECGGNGKGLAIAGIIISCLEMVFIIIYSSIIVCAVLM